MIFVDATYKLLSIKAAVYLVIVEDSNGTSEIVAVCILMYEGKNSVTWFFETFKSFNNSWSKIKVVMANKDLLERDVIKTCFPQARVLICVFHTKQIFNRKITCEKMDISGQVRDKAKEILNRMVHCKSEEDYFVLYEELKALVAPNIMTYFNNNCHKIRLEWTLNDEFVADSLGNTTNNRVESTNAMLKKTIQLNSSLEAFVESFFKVMCSQRINRDHVMATTVLKKKVLHFEKGSPEEKYLSVLTKYAFNRVNCEMEAMKKVKQACLEHYGSTCDSCSCQFSISMRLPCR